MRLLLLKHINSYVSQIDTNQIFPSICVRRYLALLLRHHNQPHAACCHLPPADDRCLWTMAGQRDRIRSTSKIFFVSLSYASVDSLLLLCHQVLALSDASSSPAMGTSSRVARAAIAQLCSTRDKQSNLINIAKCAGWAQREHAQMLFLPECLGFMGDK